MTLQLFDFQKVGAAFLASKERAGLFDDLGVGKTAQTIAALDKVKACKVLIICPAAVREVWIGEFKKFSAIPRKVLKGSTIQDLNLWLKGRADVLILSYDMATRWARHLGTDIIDVVIFDEAHRLKSKGSNRTSAALGSECDGKHGYARFGAHVWFLTGTPNPNDAADIWSLMRFCNATPLGQRIFRDRYYKKRTGAYSTTHIPRDEMVPELKQAIRSFSLRRTKKEAGLQLPSIWLTTVTVDGDTAEIRELLRSYPGLEDAIKEAVEKGGLSFLDAQHIATLRRLVGEAKAPAYAEMLKEELHDGLEKIVVFGIHKRALDHIAEAVRGAGFGCVRFDGSTSERNRAAGVDQFMQDTSCRVFLGNIRAGGSGLTLVSSASIDMFESDWAPAENAQALMRVHRIGQEKAVRARFITLAKSIDEYVSETVARKTANIAKVGFGSGVMGA